MTDMQIDLSEIPGAFEIRLGLPRPNWEAIAAWVDRNIAVENLDSVWQEIARHWATRLIANLGPDYAFLESDNFLLLSGGGDETRERLIFFCERSLRSICDMLDGVAQDEGYGKHVALAFDSDDAYYDYIADFYPEEGEYGKSGGFFFADGYGHFAFRYYDTNSAEMTIVHEMTHSLLWHLPLPLWLNEGLTQIVEESVCGSSSFFVDRKLAQRHRAYWSAKSMDDFWSGVSFHSPDEGQELSYHLAQVLVRNLISDYQGEFLTFVRMANAIDAGESAARETLGVGLSDRVNQFLGQGDWTPGPNYHLETDEGK